MHNNFWQELNTGFFALAPMEEVTDTVFREVVMSVSDSSVLNVVFTEFTSTDGLCHSKGREKTIERLFVSKSEKQLLNERNTKLVAQIWGSNPEKFKESASFISSLNVFDGIDINMGCPVKKVIKKKCCSALINYPQLAKEIIFATMEGSNLPVSVKTRIGFNTVDTEAWLGHILETKPQAITVHGRTQKMMSEGIANWDEIAKVVKLRDRISQHTKILGNGDVRSYNDGLERFMKYKVDGIMVGTGVFKNPWLFNRNSLVIELINRLTLLKKHITLFDETWSSQKNYNVLKRFFKIYISNFNDAAYLREMLMKTKNTTEALEMIGQFENSLKKSNSLVYQIN